GPGTRDLGCERARLFVSAPFMNHSLAAHGYERPVWLLTVWMTWKVSCSASRKTAVQPSSFLRELPRLVALASGDFGSRERPPTAGARPVPRARDGCRPHNRLGDNRTPACPCRPGQRRRAGRD